MVLVLGPHRSAVSGVSTHLNVLFGSQLAEEFSLVHFQVGSEGSAEGAARRLLRLISSPFALAAAILWRGAALVHLNTSFNVRAFWRDLGYLVVARLCGAKVLYQVHGGALPQQFFARSRVLTAFLRWTLRWPAAIAVLAQVELEAYRRFAPGQHVLAIPNAIDCVPYAALRRSRSDPARPLVLAYVGRLIRSKGVYEAVQAIGIAAACGIKARLVVAGSGPEESALPEYAHQLGVASDVRFTGPVYGEDKIRVLADADAFVFATYHPEGLPYALLEAMAAGLPVITSRIGAIPDVVTDGVHGLFVPPRDAQAIARAIGRLAQDRAALERMSDACRLRIASGYSLERLAGRFRNLYAEICAAGQIKAADVAERR